MKVKKHEEYYTLTILPKLKMDDIKNLFHMNPFEFMNTLNKQFNADYNDDLGIHFIKEEDAQKAKDWMQSMIIMNTLEGKADGTEQRTLYESS